MTALQTKRLAFAMLATLGLSAVSVCSSSEAAMTLLTNTDYNCFLNSDFSVVPFIRVNCMGLYSINELLHNYWEV